MARATLTTSNTSRSDSRDRWKLPNQPCRSVDEVPGRPLADRLRPTQLDDVVGQDHLLALDAPLGPVSKSWLADGLGAGVGVSLIK